jgi:hypothetical protein
MAPPAAELEPITPQLDLVETAEPDAVLEPDTALITSPSPEIDGCVWQERRGSHDVRCGEPTLPNRPFCTEHERRFQAGKQLRNRGLLSPIARDY